jgi:hypothetical protein
MKERWTSAPWAVTAAALMLAAASAASQAAPAMSVDAQALAHWVHYMRLNVNRQHADEPFIVVDSEQLRWWLVDPKGRWSVNGPALLWPAADRTTGGLRPLLPAPAARPSADRGLDGG